MWIQGRVPGEQLEGYAHYRVFLLRCWLEEDAAPDHRPHWRFMIQQVAEEPTRQGFGCLADLMRHLELTLAADISPPQGA